MASIEAWILKKGSRQIKGLGAPCREKPLEKSGLEPAAPNRLADRKHCALSTHPNGYHDVCAQAPFIIGIQSVGGSSPELNNRPL